MTRAAPFGSGDDVIEQLLTMRRGAPEIPSSVPDAVAAILTWPERHRQGLRTAIARLVLFRGPFNDRSLADDTPGAITWSWNVATGEVS